MQNEGHFVDVILLYIINSSRNRCLIR